jgi:RNA-splicing ligase RtcB
MKLTFEELEKKIDSLYEREFKMVTTVAGSTMERKETVVENVMKSVDKEVEKLIVDSGWTQEEFDKAFDKVIEERGYFNVDDKGNMIHGTYI